MPTATRQTVIRRIAADLQAQGMSRPASLAHARHLVREWDLAIVDPKTGTELLWIPDNPDLPETNR